MINDEKQSWVPQYYARGTKEVFDALINKGLCVEQKIGDSVTLYSTKPLHKGPLLTMKETILEDIENNKELLEGNERE